MLHHFRLQKVTHSARNKPGCGTKHKGFWAQKSAKMMVAVQTSSGVGVSLHASGLQGIVPQERSSWKIGILKFWGAIFRNLLVVWLNVITGSFNMIKKIQSINWRATKTSLNQLNQLSEKEKAQILEETWPFLPENHCEKWLSFEAQKETTIDR